MPASRVSIPATYADLKKAVEAVVFKGRSQIEQAWTRTYHETGRLINEHILKNEDRAGYGARVFEKLAADTGISKRTLHECAQFHRCFPIVRTSAQLTRSHYIALCQVGDAGQRQTLLREVVKRHWTVAELVQRVRPLNAQHEAEAVAVENAAPSLTLLKPKRGTPGVCQVVVVGERLVADLGFATFLDLDPAGKFKAGGLVQWDDEGRITVAPEAGKRDLFTYRAVILKVVDGDTLWVRVDLRPGLWVKQKLRLRDLDCPELTTPEGRAAKRFVETLLTVGSVVTICTTKPDKYDRYLADVFCEGTRAKGQVASNGDECYLNNALLAAGHAVRKQAWEFSDWGA